jgi:Acetoacetate decarboxylase (ADC)
MITASRFMQSPVGPYLQLAVALPARLGGRFGWCVTHLVVDKQDARTGARLNWGFPAELGTLRWREDEGEQELVWEEREVAVRARARGPKVPLAVPHRELQQRGDGPVIVPDRLLGMFRVATVRIQAFPGDELSVLAGRHLGSVVGGANRVVREARTPVGLIAPLRAPVGVTEPLLSELPRAS